MNTPRAAHIRTSVIVVCAVILSRVAYSLAGVGFDMTPLTHFDQLLDPVLLRTDLWRSLFYMHSQPPLFNLYIGLVLQLFGNAAPTAFHMLAIASGCFGAVALERMLVRFGISGVVSAVIAIVFFVSPWVVLTESILFYDNPLMVLFTVAGLFALRFADGWRFVDGLIFFGALAAAALMRSMFHPVYFAGIIGVILLLRHDRWRRVIAAAALPVGLVLALYLKNLIVFGGFFGSSWMGGNLYSPTVQQMSMSTRQRLVADSTFTRAALVEDPFSPLDSFRVHGLGDYLPAPTGIPALDQELKSTGYPNNNNIAYIRLHRLYLHDALTEIRTHPKAYAITAAKAYIVFCYPVTQVWCFDSVRPHVRFVDALYNHLFLGTVLYENSIAYGLPRGTSESVTRNFLVSGLFLMIGLPVLLGLWAVRIWRSWRSDAPADARIVTAAFMVATIVFVLLTSSAFSLAENSRYRFVIDPYLIALTAALIADWWRRRRTAHLDS